MRISYKFWPVGQGLFSSGMLDLHLPAQIKVRWIYDCGTVSAQGYVDSAIGNLKKSWSGDKTDKPKIDLLVISHFDSDHISGMTKLLSKFVVGTILLPYMPLWQRLLHALAEGIEIDNKAIDFFIDPASYIANIEGVEVSELLFVPPSDGVETSETNNRDNNVLLQGMRRDVQTNEDQYVRSNNNSFAVNFLTSQSIVVKKAFEFVPYNDGQVIKKIMPIDMGIFQKIVACLVSELLTEKSCVVLRELKKIYDCQFGNSYRKRNLISLFLYAGPVDSHDIHDICGFSVQAIKKRPIFLRRNHSVLHTSILYTGDGYLNTRTRLNALKTYLGNSRLQKILCLQVMHHGAKGNWQPGLANQIAPKYSVFSSDPGNKKTKHPNKFVKNDFKKYGPVQVNNSSFKLDFFAC